MPALPDRLDHLVLGTPSLDQEITRLEVLTGVRAAGGGRHPGEGTHNALLAVGPASYLELIAADPTQAAPDRPRWFGLDDLTGPRLITWAAKAVDLTGRVGQAARAGLRLGAVRTGSRRRENGDTLSWELTAPDLAQGGGVVPFLIDWGGSPHPAGRAPGGIALVSLRAEHPDPAELRRLLRSLDLALEVSPGPAAALVATLDTPRGRVELR